MTPVKIIIFLFLGKAPARGESCAIRNHPVRRRTEPIVWASQSAQALRHSQTSKVARTLLFRPSDYDSQGCIRDSRLMPKNNVGREDSNISPNEDV